jgi:peptidoglycan/LPS O-acetylase OafA/YrhL
VSVEKKEAPRVYFEHLDVLRCIAALMVLCSHAFENAVGRYGFPLFMTKGDTNSLTFGGQYIYYIMRNGGFGVDVFLLISGFLITYLLLVEKSAKGKIHLGNFYIRRTLRIWPLYFFIMALAPFLVKWLETGMEPPYLMTALFLNNFATIESEYWVYPFAHFWSICVEEHFYLVWPFIIAFIPNRHLVKFFVFVILASIISRGLFTHYGMGYYYQYLHTLSRMDSLAIGAIGAYFYHERPIRLQISSYYRWSAYLLFIAMFGYEAYNNYEGMFLACFRKYLYVGIVAFAMLNFMFHEKPLIRFSKKNILHFLGKISYGLYMYGALMVIIIDRKIMPMLPQPLNNFAVLLILNLVLTFVVAFISYHTLERFFMSLKTRFEVIKTRG